MPEKRKKSIGDRYDAKHIKDIDGLHTVMTHLMPLRTESEVYVSDKLDVTALLRFINEHNTENPHNKINLFQCCVTALLRMIWECPQMNRFVQGRRIYERNAVTLGFMCKLSFDENAEETAIIITAKPDDDVFSIGKRMSYEIKKAKKKISEANKVDETVNKLGRLPRPVLMGLMRTLRWMDFWGINLTAVTEGDPNYCSVLVSNLGSIGMPSAHHHLNNYGTNSMVVTLGILHKEEIILPDESRVIRDILDIGTTVDERVTDGFCFAQGVKLLKHIIGHPEILNTPFSEPCNKK